MVLGSWGRIDPWCCAVAAGKPPWAAGAGSWELAAPTRAGSVRNSSAGRRPAAYHLHLHSHQEHKTWQLLKDEQRFGNQRYFSSPSISIIPTGCLWLYPASRIRQPEVHKNGGKKPTLLNLTKIFYHLLEVGSPPPPLKCEFPSL